jgi:hypothetical protein
MPRRLLHFYQSRSYLRDLRIDCPVIPAYSNLAFTNVDEIIVLVRRCLHYDVGPRGPSRSRQLQRSVLETSSGPLSENLLLRVRPPWLGYVLWRRVVDKFQVDWIRFKWLGHGDLSSLKTTLMLSEELTNLSLKPGGKVGANLDLAYVKVDGGGSEALLRCCLASHQVRKAFSPM